MAAWEDLLDTSMVLSVINGLFGLIVLIVSFIFSPVESPKENEDVGHWQQLWNLAHRIMTFFGLFMTTKLFEQRIEVKVAVLVIIFPVIIVIALIITCLLPQKADAESTNDNAKEAWWCRIKRFMHRVKNDYLGEEILISIYEYLDGGILLFAIIAPLYIVWQIRRLIWSCLVKFVGSFIYRLRCNNNILPIVSPPINNATPASDHSNNVNEQDTFL